MSIIKISKFSLWVHCLPTVFHLSSLQGTNWFEYHTLPPPLFPILLLPTPEKSWVIQTRTLPLPASPPPPPSGAGRQAGRGDEALGKVSAGDPAGGGKGLWFPSCQLFLLTVQPSGPCPVSLAPGHSPVYTLAFHAFPTSNWTRGVWRTGTRARDYSPRKGCEQNGQ